MEERQRSRKKKESPEGGMTKRTAVIAAACAGAVIAACAGFYVYKSITYKNTFLPGTWLNGQSVAGMTVEEAEHLIDEGTRNYSLSLGLRGGESETLKGSEIGLHTVFDGSLDRVIEQQNPYAWPAGLFRQVEYTLDTMVAFDEEKLKEKLDSFACFDETTTQAPMDASISAYQEGSGYSIIPETEGSRVKEDEALEAVKAAVTSLRESISFEEEGLYEEPALTKDSEALVAVADTLNRYVGTKVTYKFGDVSEVLSGSRIKDWLSVADKSDGGDRGACEADSERGDRGAGAGLLPEGGQPGHQRLRRHLRGDQSDGPASVLLCERRTAGGVGFRLRQSGQGLRHASGRLFHHLHTEKRHLKRRGLRDAGGLLDAVQRGHRAPRRQLAFLLRRGDL